MTGTPLTTQLHPTNYPAFCEQPATPIAVFSNEQTIFVGYERQRDFLSAPKAHILLEFTPQTLITVNGSGMDDALWHSLQALPYGIYTYQLDQLPYLLLYNQQQIIEIQSNGAKKCSELYHCASVFEAIAQSMATSRNA